MNSILWVIGSAIGSVCFVFIRAWRFIGPKCGHSKILHQVEYGGGYVEECPECNLSWFERR